MSERICCSKTWALDSSANDPTGIGICSAGGIAAFPNDAGMDLVTYRSMDHDFIDQATQQGFFLGTRELF